MSLEQTGRAAVLLESLLTDINALSNPQDFLAFKKDFAFANGVGANQADKRWSSAGRSLATTASENLDLAGTLTDYRGNVLTFARIKAIAIFNNGPNTIAVGGAASNAFVNWVGTAAHTLNVRSGGLLLLLAPDATAYAVTASTGDILKIANLAAGAITYDIALVGASS